MSFTITNPGLAFEDSILRSRASAQELAEELAGVTEYVSGFTARLAFIESNSDPCLKDLSPVVLKQYVVALDDARTARATLNALVVMLERASSNASHS